MPSDCVGLPILITVNEAADMFIAWATSLVDTAAITSLLTIDALMLEVCKAIGEALVMLVVLLGTGLLKSTGMTTAYSIRNLSAASHRRCPLTPSSRTSIGQTSCLSKKLCRIASMTPSLAAAKFSLVIPPSSRLPLVSFDAFCNLPSEVPAGHTDPAPHSTHELADAKLALPG